MTYTLRAHQALVEPLLRSGSAILWHDMRTGKTRAALHAYNQMLEAAEVRDLVVVTVASAKVTWQQEVLEMGLSIPTFILAGRKPIPPPDPLRAFPRIYIVNWEIFPKWVRTLKRLTHEQGRRFVL